MIYYRYTDIHYTLDIPIILGLAKILRYPPSEMMIRVQFYIMGYPSASVKTIELHRLILFTMLSLIITTVHDKQTK